MRLKQRRRGNAGVLTLLVIAVIGLAIWNFFLQRNFNKTKAAGKALTEWIARSDGPNANFTGGALGNGLTSYLIDLERRFHDHEHAPIGPGIHQMSGPPDSHKDPPPPPPWPE
jgi:hypothetical protein